MFGDSLSEEIDMSELCITEKLDAAFAAAQAGLGETRWAEKSKHFMQVAKLLGELRDEISAIKLQRKS
jgi:hypothetical protein